MLQKTFEKCPYMKKYHNPPEVFRMGGNTSSPDFWADNRYLTPSDTCSSKQGVVRWLSAWVWGPDRCE